jgi:hypothetical protein
MTGSMTFTIPLPDPGDVSAHDLGDALTVLIENTADSRGMGKPAVTPAISYTVVDVAGATRVHAAVVKHHSQRSVVSRSTMCSVTKVRRVTRRRRDQDLSAVTCQQCRGRLQKLGALMS